MAKIEVYQPWTATVASPNTYPPGTNFSGSCWPHSANNIVGANNLPVQGAGGVIFHCIEGYKAVCTGSPQKYREHIRILDGGEFLGKFGVGQWTCFWLKAKQNKTLFDDFIVVQFNGGGAPEWHLVINKDGKSFDLSNFADFNDGSGTNDPSVSSPKLLDTYPFTASVWIKFVVFRRRALSGDSGGKEKLWINDQLVVNKNTPTGRDWVARGYNGDVRCVPGPYPGEIELPTDADIQIELGPVTIVSGDENDPDAYALVSGGAITGPTGIAFPTNALVFTTTSPEYSEFVTGSAIFNDSEISDWIFPFYTNAKERYLEGTDQGGVASFDSAGCRFDLGPLLSGVAINGTLLGFNRRKVDRGIIPFAVFYDIGGGDVLVTTGFWDTGGAVNTGTIETLVTGLVIPTGHINVAIEFYNDGMTGWFSMNAIGFIPIAASAGSDISLVSNSVGTRGQSVNSISVAKSAGGSNGDMHLIMHNCKGDNNDAGQFSGLTGQTLVCPERCAHNGGDRAQILTYRFKDASDPATFVAAIAETSISARSQTALLANVDPTTPWLNVDAAHAVDADATSPAKHYQIEDGGDTIVMGAVTALNAGDTVIDALSMVSGNESTPQSVVTSIIHDVVTGAITGGNITAVLELFDSFTDSNVEPWSKAVGAVADAAGAVFPARTYTFNDALPGEDLIVFTGLLKRAPGTSSTLSIKPSSEWATPPIAIKNDPSLVTDNILDEVEGAIGNVNIISAVAVTPSAANGAVVFVDRTVTPNVIKRSAPYLYSGIQEYDATVQDSNGNTFTRRVQVTIANSAPVLGSIPAIIGVVNSTISVDLAGKATDPNNDPVKYVIENDTDTTDSDTTIAMNADGHTLEITIGATPNAKAGLTIKADDESSSNRYSNIVELDFTAINVALAPTGEDFEIDVPRNYEEYLIPYLSHFSDPNGLDLVVEEINLTTLVNENDIGIPTSNGTFFLRNVKDLRFTSNTLYPWDATVVATFSITVGNGFYSVTQTVTMNIVKEEIDASNRFSAILQRNQ